MKLNINTDAAVVFTNKLEKMKKSALPVAVFNTLNKAAFDVKMNTMPNNVDKTFTKRQPNFFKANSRVEKASGFNIQTMKSTVGFVARSGKLNYAVKELEQQEDGGIIRKRKLVPLDTARKGNAQNQMVRANARLGKIKNMIKTSNVKGKSAKEKFVKAAALAGTGGYVLSGKKNIVFKIDKFDHKSKLKGKITSMKLKVTPLYKYKRTGTVKINNATKFMQKSSNESAQKMEKFFIENAKITIDKLK